MKRDGDALGFHRNHIGSSFPHDFHGKNKATSAPTTHIYLDLQILKRFLSPALWGGPAHGNQGRIDSSGKAGSPKSLDHRLEAFLPSKLLLNLNVN